MEHQQATRDLQAGREAKLILESEVFSTAYDDIRDSILRNWIHTSVNDTVGREMYWMQMKALVWLREELRKRIDAAVLAEHALSR